LIEPRRTQAAGVWSEVGMIVCLMFCKIFDKVEFLNNFKNFRGAVEFIAFFKLQAHTAYPFTKLALERILGFHGNRILMSLFNMPIKLPNRRIFFWTKMT
jgi:hypothetical protein